MAVPRTKVSTISPYQVVEAGITAMLERHSHIELVHHRAPAGQGAPDIVLYDVLGLLDDDQAEFTQLVNQTTSIVFAIGRDQRPDLVDQALTRGADGCFLMSIGETDLVAMLDAAMTRDRPSATSSDPIICACPTGRRAPRLGSSVGLRAREVQVLISVARGLSNEEIAAREFLSINTVKTYVRSAYAKIGVHTRSQAVLWVLQHGFDDQPEN